MVAAAESVGERRRRKVDKGDRVKGDSREGGSEETEGKETSRRQ